jgi:hypothetical protein
VAPGWEEEVDKVDSEGQEVELVWAQITLDLDMILAEEDLECFLHRSMRILEK